MTRKVLVVDDEMYIRQGISALIERSGLSFQVIKESSNGENALEMMKKEKFDLVIADIRMPFMDGITMLKEADKLEHKPCFIILSGYEDFNYAKEAIKYGARDYLLKPVDRFELIEAMEKAEKELAVKENASTQKLEIENTLNMVFMNELNYILLNDNLTDGEINTILETMKIDVFTGSFRTATIQVLKNMKDGWGEHYLPLEMEFDAFFEKLKSRRIIFKDRNGNIVLVFDSTVDFEYMILKISDKYKGLFFIGLSSLGHGTGDFRKTYHEAYEALKYRLVSDSEVFARLDEVGRTAERFQINVGLIKKVSEMIGTHRSNEINDAIDQLFDSRLIEKNSIKYVDEMVEDINSYIIEPYERHLYEQDQELKSEFEEIKNVYNFNSLHEYVFALKNFIVRINEYLYELKKELRKKNTINIALDWLNKNYYRDDITMSLVANQVSLNYSYFSLAFKEHTGISFVMYLKKLRIEKAKELLKKEELKINEIARKVGFQSPKLFSKSFCEDVGISPLEYRKKLIL